MKFTAIALHEEDNVAVVLCDVLNREEKAIVGGRQEREVEARDDIRFGHKIALRDIARGDVIRKYGRPIGVSTRDIQKGEHVHVHNVGGLRAGARSEERGEARP